MPCANADAGRLEEKQGRLIRYMADESCKSDLYIIPSCWKMEVRPGQLILGALARPAIGHGGGPH
jgi:hypothetical protein